MTRQVLSTQTLWLSAKDNLLSNSGPISSVHLSVSPFDHELYLATTSNHGYLDYDDPSFSYDPDEAQFKALMKAVATRTAFCRPTRHIIERTDRLSHAYLNPIRFAPLEENRAAERNLKPFRANRRLRWTIGTTFDGRPVYVPEDLVYRGQSRDYLYFANDSGIAAHPDKLTAIEEAVMSRIRADACMRTWYKRLEPYVLDPMSLPEGIKSRIECWHANGRKLTVAQLDNDYGEVYLAILRGPNYPCFACGVGATINGETTRAIMEAIAAAETNFGVFASFSGEASDIAPSNITSPLDHASYYCDPEHSRATEFLTARKQLSAPFSRPSLNIIELMQRLDLVVCWLTHNPSAPYHVARVFSRHLVPISYGYGLEHSTHEALTYSSAPVDETNRYLPHPFYHP